MLSYAPLDDDEIEENVIKKSPPLIPEKKECECTYLVMFFVIGAIILSMT